MASFIEVRVARKPHIPGTPTGGCEECRRTIKTGEKYERLSATPRDEIYNCDQWSHLKVHYPYGICRNFR